MKSWKLHYPGVTCAAVCLVLVMTFATGCSYRSGDMYSDWRGVNTNRYVITDEDIQTIIANTRPSPRNLQAHFRQGLIFQARGQHKLAIDEFNRVLMIDPSHTKAHNAIGVSLDNVGYYEAAVRHYQTALSLDPELDYVYNNLGYSYFLQGNYTAAIESFQKAVELNQGKMIYHNNLGMAYAQKGLFDEALAQFERHPLTTPVAKADKTGTETKAVQDNPAQTSELKVLADFKPAAEAKPQLLPAREPEKAAVALPPVIQAQPVTKQYVKDSGLASALTQVETPTA
jgi:tetratricopeptide (TPR) repeat protein